jgi:hypothetical protein
MTPRCLYLYYIWKQEYPTGKPEEPYEYRYHMYHYYYSNKNEKISSGDLRYVVEELTENARKNEALQTRPPTGQAWEFLVWTRKSYIVFVVDDSDVEFGEGDPIVFEISPGQTSHSFAEFGTFSIPNQDGTKKVSVAHCKNYMKTAGGYDIGKTSERFTILLNTKKPISIKRREGPKPDDGGNNLGPPVPPP